MTHTPGPFQADPDGTIARNEMVIGRVFRNAANSRGGKIIDLPWRQNAALFAAAPDLLEFCKQLQYAHKHGTTQDVLNQIEAGGELDRLIALAEAK